MYYIVTSFFCMGIQCLMEIVDRYWINGHPVITKAHLEPNQLRRANKTKTGFNQWGGGSILP